MKRIIAILLTVITLLSFSACSAFLEGFEEGYNDAIAELNESTNAEITRGTIENNTYSSTYTGLTFTKPDSWTYSSDEEIADLISVSADDLDMNAFSQTATQIASVYDMMVTDILTGTNVIIGYENVSITNGGSISEKDYMDAIQASLPDTLPSELIAQSNVTLGDNSYLRTDFNVSSQGVEMLQTYYIRSMGDFVNFAIVTIPSGYDISDIEAMFS